MWEFATYSLIAIMGGLVLIGVFFAIRNLRTEEKDISNLSNDLAHIEKEDSPVGSYVAAMMQATTKISELNADLHNRAILWMRKETEKKEKASKVKTETN